MAVTSSTWRDLPEPMREQLASLCRAIAMADKTTYEHHEPRKRDGEPPPKGDTIWLTPREMALGALRAMGEETKSLYWPFKKPEVQP